MRGPSSIAVSAFASLVFSACTAESTAPSAPPDGIRGSLEIAGQVVRSELTSDVPVSDVTLYLFMPATADTKNAQWVDYGAVSGFYSRTGFWAVKVAHGRTEASGAFRFSGLREGSYVLWLVPDVLKGCGNGAIVSLRVQSDIQALLVRAS